MTAPITWAEASSPIYWSNIGINWNTPAKTESETFGIDTSYILGHDHTLAGYAVISITMGYQSGNSFLWNPIADPNDNWTPVSNPTSIWTEQADPSSVWTKSDYPD